MKIVVMLMVLFFLASCTEPICRTQIRYNEMYEAYAEDMLKYDYFVPVMDKNQNLRVVIIQDTCTSCTDQGMRIGTEEQEDSLVATEEVINELNNNLESVFHVTAYSYKSETGEEVSDLTKWIIEDVEKVIEFSGCCSEEKIEASMNAYWWKEGTVSVSNFRKA